MGFDSSVEVEVQNPMNMNSSVGVKETDPLTILVQARIITK